MKSVANILFLGFVLAFSTLKGQDVHLAQFYATPLYLNPSFAGANVCSRVALTYRDQWPGIKTAYKSFLFSIDHSLPTYNLGVGFQILSDVAGSGDLRTTLINPIISYGVKVNRKLAMRFGFQPGVGIRSINTNNLVFGDQIARGGNVASVEDLPQAKAYFDAGAGFLLYTEKLWLGGSTYHLSAPNTSLLGGEEIRPIKISVHGGAKIPLNEKEHDEYLKRSISPAFHYRGQEKFDQFDIGLYFTQYIINLGLWYRGIPIFKAYQEGYPNHDALVFIVGVQTDRLNVGYSFDKTISYLNGLTKGAHELTLSYQMCKQKTKKKKYGLVIPCPKF